jgi:hypothetical protein
VHNREYRITEVGYSLVEEAHLRRCGNVVLLGVDCAGVKTLCVRGAVDR